MNRSVKLILLVLILFLVGIDSFSQYYAKFKGDSVSFENDSVVLTLDNNITSNLHWERSKDSVSWEPLNTTNDTLVARINESYFYRAVLSEGTCYPIKSDVAFAGFNSIEVSGSSVVVDSTGGVYILTSGIKLVVPPNAVIENVTLTLDLLDSVSAEIQMPFDADTGKVFCAAIQCEPIQFLKPIKISIPAPNIQYNDLPNVYLRDDVNGFWEKFTEKLIFSERMQFIEFSSDKLVSTRIQLFKDLFEFGSTVKDANPEEEKCEEGFIEAISDEFESIGQKGSKECYVSSSKTSVRFLECPGSPVNEARIEEIGKDCQPLAEDNFDEIKCLKKDKSATINVKVTIGGMPLKDQHIEFCQLPDGLSIDKTEGFTNAAGEEQFEVTCNKENFSGTIKYRVTYLYYLEVVNASGDGISEKNENYPQSDQIEKDHFIDVCSISSIELTNANVMLLESGGKIQLHCRCLDSYGESIDCENIEYSLTSWGSYPMAGATVSEAGILTASSGGVVSIKVRSGSVESKKTKIATVEYKGSLPDLQLTSDHNVYKLCGCQEDYDNPPHEWQWWIVDFTGSLEISMYLDPDLDLLPIASLTGTGSITYSITGSKYCTDASFPETIRSHSAGWLVVPSENVGSGPFTMEDLIKGKNCIVEFEYEDFRQFYWHILRGTAQLTSNGIEFSILDWRPDACIHRDVEGSCILK